jgi:predicted  nucleic acid-binding Zn-ribbon protein
MEVMDLKVEVKTAQLQSAALREEARLSSNVRLKLKQQLAAEKKRSEVLEEQVFEWKQKFKQITSGERADAESAGRGGGEKGVIGSPFFDVIFSMI